jgi:hypothetical protein
VTSPCKLYTTPSNAIPKPEVYTQVAELCGRHSPKVVD